MNENFDLLKKVEELTESVNREMRHRSQFALKRYPLTFGLLGIFGAVAVSEGIKGILENFGFKDHPAYLLILGLLILTTLGLIYKKLEKGGD